MFKHSYSKTFINGHRVGELILQAFRPLIVNITISPMPMKLIYNTDDSVTKLAYYAHCLPHNQTTSTLIYAGQSLLSLQRLACSSGGVVSTPPVGFRITTRRWLLWLHFFRRRCLSVTTGASPGDRNREYGFRRCSGLSL